MVFSFSFKNDRPTKYSNQQLTQITFRCSNKKKSRMNSWQMVTQNSLVSLLFFVFIFILLQILNLYIYYQTNNADWLLLLFTIKLMIL